MARRWLIFSCFALVVTGFHSNAQQTNSIGISLVEIQPGSFSMGSTRGKEDADESPVHTVNISKAFKISATEITNQQYEAFDPSHSKLRGKNGFSIKDDEAVVSVSYDEAVAFCAWLSKKEGKLYRLPTEAEWEYVCRAGTTTAYHTGDELPAAYQKLQHTNRNPVPVSLQVAQTPPNAWGVYDMHGNVEEWCSDWYGAYVAGEQTDPIGRKTGMSRVTRGGSHNTPVKFLRSANRQGMLPEDKHWLTGFRIVQGALPATKPLPAEAPAPFSTGVAQQKMAWKKVAAPLFETPIVYVVKPDSTSGVPFYKHNHCPAITWCPNGDLFAIWFSCNAESGREMVILASRLRAGNTTWDTASLFFVVPDRNVTGSSLLQDEQGTLYHINGLEAAGDWQNLAMVMRTSNNNGATWTKPVLIAPEHAKRHQVIAGSLITKEGWLAQLCDADPSSNGGTALHLSKDKGKHWSTPYNLPVTPQYKNGAVGGLIAGIHASMVELKDGRFLALGRGDHIKADSTTERMAMSISNDHGATWQYSPSEFPPIASGQRLVLRRLNEGPLLMVSFTHCPGKSTIEGWDFTRPNGETYKGYGMYAALSYDDGKTWPVKKLLTDGQIRQLNGGAWTNVFTMDATHAEPRGYLAATQTPDNVIHLVSSNLHYRFTLAWLQQ